MRNVADVMPEWLSAAAFARLVGRNRSQVTRWLAGQKLSGDAVRRAAGDRIEIHVERGLAQLARHLDSSQQSAQPAPVYAQAASVEAPAAAPRNETAEALQKERLRSVTANATLAEAKALETLGQLVPLTAYNKELALTAQAMVARLDELPIKLMEATTKLLNDSSRAQELLIVYRQTIAAVRADWARDLESAAFATAA